MPPSEARQITRPRPSLSCVVCRRRKVRCGREQPACGNCVRIQETCEYEGDARDGSGPQAKRKPISPATTDEARTSKTMSGPPEDSRVAWSETDESPAFAHQTYSAEASAGPNTLSRHLNNVSPATPSAYHRTESGVHGTDHVLSPTTSTNTTGRAFKPQAKPRVLGHTHFTQTSWDASSKDGYDDSLQLSPSTTAVSHQKHGTGASRKRPRTPLGPTQQQELIANSVPMQGLSHNHQRASKPAINDLAIEARESAVQTPGYLSVQNGGQVRYVGKNYWALIDGHESLCDTLLNEDHNLPANVPQPHINSLGLATELKSLPTKTVSDLLFWSFLIGVRPIHPLIHVPTFRADYDSFWDWCRVSDTSLPNNKLLDDPTYICLLFAVLLCGATTAPPSFWVTGALRDFSKWTLVENLENSLMTSLKYCQYQQHPTFNTLVSSLLAHSCSKNKGDPYKEVRFVRMVVSIAQSMGLHREGKLFNLDPVTCELRRRVWWHIVWLDVQASILNGSEMYCGDSETQHDSQMVTETRDEDLLDACNGPLSPLSTPSSRKNSIMMLFTIGLYETARFENFLINQLHSTRRLGQTQFNDFVIAVRKLHFKIDHLIGRIPAQGIPEKGLIPSRLANASPLTHETLYSDHATEPTVFTSWTRIILTMLKSESAILLQKPFLGRADSRSRQSQRMWHSVIQVCITYLRHFLQVSQTPAFAPYAWFYMKPNIPLQCVFLLLTYLRHNQDSEIASLTRYLIDETIETFASSTHLSDYDTSESNGKADNQASAAWRMLLTFRRKLDLAPGVEEPSAKAAVPFRCLPLSPAISLASKVNPERYNHNTRSLSAGDWERNAPSFMAGDPPITSEYADESDLLDISDLVAWSSSLMENTNEYLLQGHEEENRPNDNGNGFPMLTKAPASAPTSFGESFDYFENWNLSEESGKNRTRAEGILASREQSFGHPNDEVNPGGYGDGSRGAKGNGRTSLQADRTYNYTSVTSNGPMINLADRLTEDDSWMD